MVMNVELLRDLIEQREINRILEESWDSINEKHEKVAEITEKVKEKLEQIEEKGKAIAKEDI